MYCQLIIFSNNYRNVALLACTKLYERGILRIADSHSSFIAKLKQLCIAPSTLVAPLPKYKATVSASKAYTSHRMNFVEFMVRQNIVNKDTNTPCEMEYQNTPVHSMEPQQPLLQSASHVTPTQALRCICENCKASICDETMLYVEEQSGTQHILCDSNISTIVSMYLIGTDLKLCRNSTNHWTSS